MTRRDPLYSARLHGARRTLEDRMAAANSARRSGPASWVRAMLGGKVAAYREAIDLIDAVEKGTRLPRRLRWTDRRRSA